jgi:hypothetical protein
MGLMEKIVHLLIPRESNNHKAKILHVPSILVISLLLLGLQLGFIFVPRTGVGILGYAANISIEEVIRLTNEKRAAAGLAPLEFNGQLAEAAKAKGNDMIARDYWAHVAPDGTEPWKFFRDVGYKYRYAGENLARDFSDASSAVNAWMASPSHKENLMSPKYKEIGVAVVEGDLSGSDTTIIVQLFGSKLADTVPAVPIAKAQTTNTETPEVKTEKKEVTEPTIKVEDKQENISAVSVTPKPNFLLSPFATTKNISLIVITLLLLVLVVDGLIVYKKGVVRIAGRTFAHLSFLGMILAIVIILKAGKIL